MYHTRLPLVEAIQSLGFAPSRADGEALFDLLVSADKELALAIERALFHLGSWAAQQAMARLPLARPPLRGRLCRLVGRIAQQTQAEDLCQFLQAALADHDPKTRRNAIIALGKLQRPDVEQTLLHCWKQESTIEQRRSLAAALGKVGGTCSLACLRVVETSDPELRRIIDEAILKIERTLGRQDVSLIDPHLRILRPVRALLHCRSGLEKILHEEVDPTLHPRIRGPGLVQVRLAGSLAELYQARTLLRFGFPLPAQRLGEKEDVGQAVARALSSVKGQAIFRTWTVGAMRYRLEWAAAGHRRAATWRCVQAVSRISPTLINDPTASPWEAIITERNNQVEVELWPRGLADPRFSYRRRDVPAASHPTLAAALARLAGVRPEDIVWDPFVGSGTELIERALLGPYAKLYGSDHDPAALETATENLKAAGLSRWALATADARTHRPADKVTLIITNPPMGRRVLSRGQIHSVYAACLTHWSQILAPGGRLVWISPLFQQTMTLAQQAGLSTTFHRRVDMGGFTAELQTLVKLR